VTAICPGVDTCALVRDDLASGECELRERLTSIEADVLAYRTALVEAIHLAHDLVMERDRLRRECGRLRAQIRELVGVARAHDQTRQRRSRAA
jgi:hypothetical protein